MCAPISGSRHQGGWGAWLPVHGLEPVTDVLLGVASQDGRVGLAGPGVAHAGPVLVGLSAAWLYAAWMASRRTTFHGSPWHQMRCVRASTSRLDARYGFPREEISVNQLRGDPSCLSGIAVSYGRLCWCSSRECLLLPPWCSPGPARHRLLIRALLVLTSTVPRACLPAPASLSQTPGRPAKRPARPGRSSPTPGRCPALTRPRATRASLGAGHPNRLPGRDVPARLRGRVLP